MRKHRTATIRRSIEIAADAGTLFALTQEYSLRARWDPLPGDYEFLDGVPKGPRAMLSYRTRGMTMKVCFVSYQPPERAAITMIDGPRLLERLSGSWNFKRLGAARTLVVFQYHFALRPRWLHRLLRGIAGALIGSGVDARLRGLKEYAEHA